MSHKVQRDWTRGLKIAMPRFFKERYVLEMGSLNVNGTLRDLFEDSYYVGVDVIPGPDVDIVGTFHEIKLPSKEYDVVCSVNSLEHDMHWEKTLPRMYELLEPGGLMFISAAAAWSEHGTAKCTDWASGTAQIDDPKWNEYYRNLTVADFHKHFKYDMFRWYMLGICDKDIQFVGIK